MKAIICTVNNKLNSEGGQSESMANGLDLLCLSAECLTREIIWVQSPTDTKTVAENFGPSKSQSTSSLNRKGTHAVSKTSSNFNNQARSSEMPYISQLSRKT